MRGILSKENLPLPILLLVGTLVVSLFLFYAGGALAAEGINETINFQGKVVNADGTNVTDGNYDFEFKLYTVSSGGTSIWTETWNSGTSQVAVDDGIFQVALGTHQSLSAVDFNQDTLYISVNFNGDGEMSPRIRLTAAPYAFNAQELGGLTGSQFLRSDTSASYTSGTLTFDGGTTLDVSASTLTLASNQISWGSVSKSGSSLADLGTRSAGALSSGNLDIARLPTSGNWDISADLSIESTTFFAGAAGGSYSGRVGIGTATPAASLELAAGTPELRVTNSGTSEYTRVVRTAASNLVAWHNRVSKPGVDPYALEFDGNDEVQVPDNASIRLAGGDFTVRAWVYLNSAASSTSRMIVEKIGAVYARDWNVGIDSTRHLTFKHWGDSGGNYASTGTVPLTTWTHVQVSVDQTNDLVYFAIGGTIESQSFTSSFQSESQYDGVLRIGRDSGQFPAQEDFDGRIDELELSNTVRNTSNFTPSTTRISPDGNTAALWHFDDGTGTNADDASANGNDGTLSANPNDPAWVTGYVTDLGSVVEATVWSSENGVAANEGGIQKFGSTEGGTWVQGQTLRFYIGASEKMRFDASGNIGVGTTTPSQTFSIVGSGCVGASDADCDAQSTTAGNLYATTRTGGSVDVAEWIKVDSDYLDEEGNTTLEAGDVLCVSSSEVNKAVACEEAYDPRLIGVVSTNPHLTMGEEYRGDDAVRLAIVGRVPVKISADSAEIEPGDFITSSSDPGKAMKAETAGYTVGRALEPWSPGDEKETITMLLNLGAYFGELGGGGDLPASLGEEGISSENSNGAATGLFENLRVTVEGIFSRVKTAFLNVSEKLVAKTAEIASAVIGKLEVGEVKVTGLVRLNLDGTRPACSASVKGGLWVGKDDDGSYILEVCAKDASNNYNWQPIQ